MKLSIPQYITDNKGRKISVVLPVKDYERMIEDLEELEDIRLYDEVKAKKEKSIPFGQYLQARKKRANG
jgi:hypothetical protein